MDYPHVMLIANCATTLKDEEPAALANAATYDQLVLTIGEEVIDKLNFIAKIPEYRNEIHEIAKKVINKTYDKDTFTSVILGDLHLAQKNLEDAYKCKATIGGKPIFMKQDFIVKRLDEVTEATTDIREKVNDIRSIRDCCGNIETLPGKEEGFAFDLKIGSETRAVRVEIYREKSIVDGMTYHNSRLTYILKDYPSLRGDVRILRADAIDALEKEGASLIDLTRNGTTEEALFKKLYGVTKLKDILDREQTVFKWQPDDMKDEDVK